MKRAFLGMGRSSTFVKLWLATCCVASAKATPIQIGADRVLGIIVPGVPASEANERVMINGLLEGWIKKDGSEVFGYNDGAASGSVLGDNPADPKDEKYVLKYTAATLIPKPAPLARENDWYKTETDDPVIDLGDYKYDWVLAKWGKDAEIYYIGDLTGVIELNRVNFEAKKHGLSHYTLFNRTAVPEAGATMALLGLGLLGLWTFARRVS